MLFSFTMTCRKHVNGLLMNAPGGMVDTDLWKDENKGFKEEKLPPSHFPKSSAKVGFKTSGLWIVDGQNADTDDMQVVTYLCRDRLDNCSS